MTAPLLVFGWGNPSRGDDALGPLCIERLRGLGLSAERVEYLEDFQLQVEHALDLQGRERVLLVDASLSCTAPFEVTCLHGARDASLGSHALSPAALLQVYSELRGEAPPPCTLLAIRGERFELGQPPSALALANLDAALQWATAWLQGSEAFAVSTPYCAALHTGCASS
jgi:hydrogenase maturation protease